MRRLTILSLILLGVLGAWAAWPSKPKPAPREDPAGNGRDAAFRRWETSQPTHWRHVITSRD